MTAQPAPQASCAGTAAPAAPRHRLLALAFSPTVLALLDQAVVSAASFLVVVLIARVAGLDALGHWALATSLVALAVAAHDALVTRPYTITRPSLAPAREIHVFAALVGTLGLGLLFGLGALGTAGIGLAAGGAVETAFIAGALALAIPAVLMRELARRDAFAALAMTRALAVDLAASGLLLAAVLALALSGMLSPLTAVLALAAATGITAGFWLIRRRAHLRPDLAGAKDALREFLRLGRWFLVSAGAAQVQGYSLHWLSFLMLGASQTGLYAACLGIIAFANPFLFGFLNLLTPRCVETLRRSGHAGLARRVAADTVVVGSVLGAFALVVWLAGEHLLLLLYADAAVAEGVEILHLLALGVLASAFGLPAAAALSSLQRARLLAIINVSVTSVTVLFVLVGLTVGGLAGGVIGLLVGEVLSTLARWSAFAAITAAGAAPSIDDQTQPEKNS